MRRLLRAASGTLTGAVGGFMLSHSVVLGRFFDGSVRSDETGHVLRAYADFREAKDPVTPYAAVWFAQLGAAALDLPVHLADAALFPGASALAPSVDA